MLKIRGGDSEKTEEKKLGKICSELNFLLKFSINFALSGGTGPNFFSFQQLALTAKKLCNYLRCVANMIATGVQSALHIFARSSVSFINIKLMSVCILCVSFRFLSLALDYIISLRIYFVFTFLLESFCCVVFFCTFPPPFPSPLLRRGKKTVNPFYT